jgi:hypothetical protein
MWIALLVALIAAFSTPAAASGAVEVLTGPDECLDDNNLYSASNGRFIAYAVGCTYPRRVKVLDRQSSVAVDVGPGTVHGVSDDGRYVLIADPVSGSKVVDLRTGASEQLPESEATRLFASHMGASGRLVTGVDRDGVFAYDRVSDELFDVSGSAEDAISPRVSHDGRWVYFLRRGPVSGSWKLMRWSRLSLTLEEVALSPAPNASCSLHHATYPHDYAVVGDAGVLAYLGCTNGDDGFYEIHPGNEQAELLTLPPSDDYCQIEFPPSRSGRFVPVTCWPASGVNELVWDREADQLFPVELFCGRRYLPRVELRDA